MNAAAIRGRRIALLGFGVENRALAHFFSDHNIAFSVCDTAVPTALRSQWPQVKNWHLGPSHLDHLAQYELLFRTPGLPILDARLQRASSNGSTISSQTQLFFSLCPCPIIAITGTKGKGTTTTLLVDLLKNGQHKRVFSGGNIGQPPIAFLEELQKDDLVVLELSSFQLQDLAQSPAIALVLSVTQDHLDYHATRAEYVEAKKSICRQQTANDLLITNADCITSSAFAKESLAQQASFSASTAVAYGAWVERDQVLLSLPNSDPIPICRTDEIRVPGRHNWENICAAVAAAAAAGAAPATMRTSIAAFRALPHRLEWVGESDDIAYYNDSLATTPDAACAALRAFDRPIVLIVGGASKGADFTELGKTIAAVDMRAVVLLGAEGPRLEKAIKAADYDGKLVADCADLQEAVRAAQGLAHPGDLVLLSPACASFDLFSNYKERGDLFKKLCGFLS